MQQTETYKLNLIETGDAFSPLPLNENAAKMEAVLREQAQTLESKAKFTAGSYTGNGTAGHVISLGFQPELLLLLGWWNGAYQAISFVTPNKGISIAASLTINTTTVITDTGFCLNSTENHNLSGKTEYYIAFG